MFRVLFLFLTRFHVNVARSNGNPTCGPKINACVLCVRVLFQTRKSFIRSFSRLSWGASYLRTGVKGCSKIRRILAKPRLILDEMCRLYGKFAFYFSSNKWPHCVFYICISSFPHWPLSYFLPLTQRLHNVQCVMYIFVVFLDCLNC